MKYYLFTIELPFCNINDAHAQALSAILKTKIERDPSEVSESSYINYHQRTHQIDSSTLEELLSWTELPGNKLGAVTVVSVRSFDLPKERHEVVIRLEGLPSDAEYVHKVPEPEVPF